MHSTERTMKNLLPISLACATLALFGRAAAAQPTMPMPPMHMMPMHMPQEISVAATGTAEYVPDIARITLGIRSESPSAATAIDTINKNSGQVIAAIKAAGVNVNSIKTVGYNLQYRERPSPGPPVPMSAQTAAAVATPGSYEASEMLQVSAPVGVAGKALDAAIGAGANESFGLSYQTSNYDSLYRVALAKAMTSARATADAIAKAAHVTIVDIQSISNSAEAQPGMQLMRAPMAQNAASVLPGTDAVTATVYVVYRIR